MFSIFLVFCELIAETVVISLDWHPRCVFPLKTWTLCLMCLQVAYIVLIFLSMGYARMLRGDPRDYSGRGDMIPTTYHYYGGVVVRYEHQNNAEILTRAERVTRAVRAVNALYLFWFVFGSAIVLKAGPCVSDRTCRRNSSVVSHPILPCFQHDAVRPTPIEVVSFFSSLCGITTGKDGPPLV